MSRKALFILNPHSGKGLIKNHLLEITDILVKADYEVTVYPTQSRGDAKVFLTCDLLPIFLPVAQDTLQAPLKSHRDIPALLLPFPANFRSNRQNRNAP